MPEVWIEKYKPNSLIDAIKNLKFIHEHKNWIQNRGSKSYKRKLLILDKEELAFIMKTDSGYDEIGKASGVDLKIIKMAVVEDTPTKVNSHVRRRASSNSEG